MMTVEAISQLELESFILQPGIAFSQVHKEYDVSWIRFNTVAQNILSTLSSKIASEFDSDKNQRYRDKFNLVFEKWIESFEEKS